MNFTSFQGTYDFSIIDVLLLHSPLKLHFFPSLTCHFNLQVTRLDITKVAGCRTPSLQCTHSKFRHHPHPLGYLCAKFRFFRGPIAELTHGEKSRTQSLTQSPGLFDTPGTEAFALEHLLIRMPTYEVTRKTRMQITHDSGIQ